MAAADKLQSDVVFADPALGAPRDIEIAVNIPVRYTLTGRIGPNGKRREFSGRVVKIASDAMSLAAPVSGAVGERVIATLLEFGKLEGRVLTAHRLGFSMSILMKEAEREKFTAKLAWYDKHQNHGVEDKRVSRRVIPENPHSVVVLGDGTVVGAFIIDMSVSGAALSADINPEIGLPLAVGKIVGRVVRRFPGGFAVKFINTQSPHTLEQWLIRPDL